MLAADKSFIKRTYCRVGEAVAVGHSLLIGQCGCRLLHVWELESVSRESVGVARRVPICHDVFGSL